MRRPALPALNAARLSRRGSLRGHTPVAATARRPPAVESLLLAARRGGARARCSRPLSLPPHSRRLDTQPPLDAAACASCAECGTSLAPRFSARSHARGRGRSSAARRRVAAARRSSRRRSRALLAPAGRPPRSRRPDTQPPLDAAACASCAERGYLSRRASLRGHTPVAATTRRPLAVESLLLAARHGDARARCSRPLVGRRVRDGSTLSRRSMRRLALPALNAAHLSRRASLRGHTPVAATARRPPAVESLLLAARRGDARARFSRPLGRPPRSRRPDTQPPLDAAACASCAERGTSLAPCFPARSHARGRDGSTAARRRVAAARRSSRRCSRALPAPARFGRRVRAGSTRSRRSTRRPAPPALNTARFLRRASLRGHTPVTATARRPRRRVAAARRSSRRRSRALLAPARSAAAFATARHSAAARRGGLRFLRCTRLISRAVVLCAVPRPWPRRLDG